MAKKARKAASSRKKKPAATGATKICEPPDFRKQLDKSVIAMPLLERMGGRASQAVVIDLNLQHHSGLPGAKIQVLQLLAGILLKGTTDYSQSSQDELLQALKSRVSPFKTDLCRQYVFAQLTPGQIRSLLDDDESRARQLLEAHMPKEATRTSKAHVRQEANRSPAHDKPGEDEANRALRAYRFQAIYKIWPDFDAGPLLTRTDATVKADAARVSFAARGKGIVWAVVDSGVDGTHPHFKRHKNLELPAPLQHADFTVDHGDSPFLDHPTDPFGHGTHVAGIIAGEIAPIREGETSPSYTAASRVRDKAGKELFETWSIDRISGIAPECKLLSIRVLDELGKGDRKASNILCALAYINKLNEYGRHLKVHGVNLSVGYEFKPDWFGCGQSPLCIEVDRLVRSGVVVVVAAGNTGYGRIAPEFGGPDMAGVALTINDPGNANLAITVGSTHRYMPHRYGVSYFSSKGPTGDGRLKPDLVAPGENVLSCAAGRKAGDVDKMRARAKNREVSSFSAAEKCRYCEDSGTSMAAPHVSGAIAAFLSIREGYQGQPDKVKEIFLRTATDLGRERYHQGHGLVDLMRAIQSV